LPWRVTNRAPENPGKVEFYP